MADRNAVSRVRLLKLHARVIAGDCPAFDELCDLLWRPLCQCLQSLRPHTSADFIEDAVSRALQRYWENPKEFNPDRGPLDAFVLGIAARIWRDRRRKENRDAARDSAYWAHRRQVDGSHDHDPVWRVQVQEMRAAARLVCTPTQTTVIQGQLDGEDPGAIATRLGLSHLPPALQRAAIKGHWKAGLKRLARGFGASLRRGGGRANARRRCPKRK